MLFLTIAQGEAADDTQPVLATCDQRLVAAVIRELQFLAETECTAQQMAAPPPRDSAGNQETRSLD
jgi:hypothetical protein